MANEDTGTGELEAETSVAPSTAEPLTPSPPNSKRATRKTVASKEIVTKNDATQILASAVRICQDAGLPVQYAQQDGVLYLILPGLEVVSENDQIVFRYVEAS
jgi:hypothetical protein